MKKKSPEAPEDKAKRLREYLDGVQRRNERSREQRERLTGSPEVGIFWVVNGKLMIAGAWIEEAMITGRFAHHPTTHEKEWSLCQRIGAVPRSMRCDDPPRGRVDLDKVTQQFHLYADVCILNDDAMVAKIRQDLHLPSEIKISNDNFYQCLKCLGRAGEWSRYMNSQQTHKRGFALNRENYIEHIKCLINTAFYYFVSARAQRVSAPHGLAFWCNTEVVRRLDLHLLNWIAVAPTNGRFGRAAAIEEAIGKVDRRSGRVWARETEVGTGVRVVGHRKLEPSIVPPADRERLEAEFFARVRTSCAAALQNRQAGRMAARPRDLFVIWDNVSTALTFGFEIEIATANRYFAHVRWWKDRVDTHLDGLLADFLERTGRRTERDLGPAIRAGVDLVPVDRIWEFAVNEIGRQLGKPSSELLMPNREAVEMMFFAKVHEICIDYLRGEHRDGEKPRLAKQE